MRIPQFSIAVKLYAIFALLAAVTVSLSVATILNARRQAALVDDFEFAFQGTLNVERINSLIYAVVMESRGIYMSTEIDTAKRYGAGLLKFNDRIGQVTKDWEKVVRSDDAEQFRAFSERVQKFQEFRRELVRRGTEINPAAGREWGDNEANRSVRTALNTDLEILAKLYAARSERIYAEMDASTTSAHWLMTLLGSAAILLAGFGAYLIRRAVVRPLAAITHVTQTVAEGAADVAVPFCDRGDEVGALARSITVFQGAMRRNEELNRTVRQETESRAERQEQMSSEIGRFATEVEDTLAQLGRIANDMLTAAAELSKAADSAASRTASAASASSEASSNVSAIASATEELSSSVREIDGRVAQSTVIANKAVDEAERTNAAVGKLDKAAARIGDVIRLITDIAEQTNLLALNASIEAARAGEAGRGFAVVAGEVKALAGQTAKATEDIGSQIGNMQEATRSAIEAIAAIERTIRDIGENSGTIAAAVTQQGAATEEIARSVESAARRSSDTAEEVSHVAAAMEQTHGSAKAVRTVADDLGAVAGRIRSQIDDFFQRLRAA
jgi:methyl-accepting chemotaxis protein